jgi:hypothetical protein
LWVNLTASGRLSAAKRVRAPTTHSQIEINPIIIDLLKRRFSDYTAIATLDGAKFEVDETRQLVCSIHPV